MSVKHLVGCEILFLLAKIWRHKTCKNSLLFHNLIDCNLVINISASFLRNFGPEHHKFRIPLNLY